MVVIPRSIYRIFIGIMALALVMAIFWRAGMTRGWVEALRETEPRPIQLRIWDWWSPSSNEEFGDYFAAVKETFERRNPDVEVIYQTVPFANYVQKLSTAMVGRTPPDLFQSSGFWSEGLYQRGMLRPLNDLISKDSVHSDGSRLDEAAFLPTAWQHNHTQDGVVFGMPMIIDASCLVWNLDILEQAAKQDEDIRDMFVRHPDGSVDYDHIRFEAVKDWDHFRRIVKKLTTYTPDGEVDQAGYTIQAYGAVGLLPHWLATNGARFQDMAGTRAMFDSPAGIETMHFISRLYWEDRVSSSFRRELTPADRFQEGKSACIPAGTYSGKTIIRNTMGWTHFGKTAFPPGPQGQGQKTVTWGNMMVISNRSTNVEAAWRYIKFVCSLEGNLLRLKHLGYNGPRFDFYETEQWRQAMAERPYLSNVKQICLAGDKLRHTEITAADHQANPIIETILLQYPDMVNGQGPYPSVEAAMHEAARNVNKVYDRYNRQVKQWKRQTP